MRGLFNGEPSMSHTSLKNWLAEATTLQQMRLAKLAKTSVNNLRQVAHGYRTKGKPSISAEYAARIELAAEKIPEVAISVKRGDLCQACAKCKYYRDCK